MSKTTKIRDNHHGKHAGKGKPRRSIAKWNPELRRYDPLAVLDEAMEGRVKALLQLKSKRMAASAFSFFRGGRAHHGL